MVKGKAPHLDKELVARSFKASAATYDDNAIVQKEISRQLVADLKEIDNIGFSRVLEIGCCTGILTRMLCDTAAIDKLYINDLVPEFCHHTKAGITGKARLVESLPGDIENTDLPKHLDLVISSSTFQWISDLPGLFDRLAMALNAHGHLAFSIFSPGTMGEIHSLTGRGLRYHSPDEIAGMLAGHFRVLRMHSEMKKLYFPTVKAVLRHIRQTGVGGVSSHKWNLKVLKEFERRYWETFRGEEGLPVTYSSTFVVAEKMRGSR